MEVKNFLFHVNYEFIIAVLECQENGNENIPELGEPSSEDYVLMKEETFSIDTNKVNRWH